MTRSQIEARIKVLNKKIDHKIINGGDSRKEEVEHANLYHFIKSMSK
jgi:hypothetical protein